MNRDETLAWLAAMQSDFGAMLRTPLNAQGGTLRATPQHYPAGLRARVRSPSSPDAAERLATYNRQYWFRLLRMLQNDLPLCCALLGPWFFNQVAMRFLQAHPPRGYDLAQVVDGFDAFVRDELEDVLDTLGASAQRVPVQALTQACCIDMAFRAVFFAPEQPDFRGPRSQCSQRSQPSQHAELAGSRLRFSAAFAQVQEHWPLVELRGQALGRNDERPLSLPPALPQAQRWALARTPRGVAQRLLAPREARLLTLLETLPLAAALAQLEAECPPDERAAMPEQIRSWLALAVELRFFRSDH